MSEDEASRDLSRSQYRNRLAKPRKATKRESGVEEVGDCRSLRQSSSRRPSPRGGGASSFPSRFPQRPHGYDRREGDWDCPSCSKLVFARKDTCFSCGTPKPRGSGGRDDDNRCSGADCEDRLIANSLGNSTAAGSGEKSEDGETAGGLSAVKSVPSPVLNFVSECQLGEAQELSMQRRFFEAFEKCPPVLTGPGKAVDKPREVCTDWEKFGKVRAVEHQDEVRLLTAQLLAARDRSDSLWRLKETERGRREEAQEHAAWLLWRSQFYDEARRENSCLKKELRELQRTSAFFPKEEVAKRLAEFEIAPLRCCDSADRAVWKKRLLLKWHPDKQPSSNHAPLATQVMQELQNCLLGTEAGAVEASGVTDSAREESQEPEAVTPPGLVDRRRELLQPQRRADYCSIGSTEETEALQKELNGAVASTKGAGQNGRGDADSGGEAERPDDADSAQAGAHVDKSDEETGMPDTIRSYLLTPCLLGQGPVNADRQAERRHTKEAIDDQAWLASGGVNQVADGLDRFGSLAWLPRGNHCPWKAPLQLLATRRAMAFSFGSCQIIPWLMVVMGNPYRLLTTVSPPESLAATVAFQGATHILQGATHREDRAAVS